MGLDRTKMQRIAGAQLGQLWLYKTPDTIATVNTSGYFTAMTDELIQFDTIIVISETGGTPKVDLAFTTSVRGVSPVTTSATEGITAT